MMAKRFPTRTWHREEKATVPTESVAQVQDPAVRAILLNERRCYISMANEIGRRCGLPPLDDDDAALTA